MKSISAEFPSTFAHSGSLELLSLFKIAAKLEDCVESALAPLPLTLREFEVLLCLAREPLPHTAIANALGTNKPAISRGVASLVASGCVRCQTVPEDKRVSVVFLTDRGSQQLAQAEKLIIELVRDLNSSSDSLAAFLYLELKALLRRLPSGGKAPPAESAAWADPGMVLEASLRLK